LPSLFLAKSPNKGYNNTIRIDSGGEQNMEKLKINLIRAWKSVVRYIRTTDRLLILLCLIASCFGLVLITSATHSTSSISRSVIVQGIALIIGIISMIIVSNFDYEILSSFAKFIGPICILILIYTTLRGVGPIGTGAKAWIKIGSYYIQPSEFVKLGFVITFAAHISAVKENINSPMNILLLIIHGLTPFALVVIQGDTGSALVFGAIFLGMMFTSGIKLRYFIGSGLAALILSPVVFNVINDDQRKRIMVLFSTQQTPTGYYFQQYFGKLAIGSGQVFGRGLFHGPEIQQGLVPKSENDFIFSVAGEELGFLGCLLVITLIFLIIWRIINTAFNSKDSLGALICAGVASMIIFQTIINIGMVLSLLPVIGITLPFFSAGGSSIFSLFTAIGLVLSVYMKNRPTLFATRE
jgi:rod shape determining protein RodA